MLHCTQQTPHHLATATPIPMLTDDDNHNTLHLNPQVFIPMLNNNLVAHNPTLHIQNILTLADFADTEFGDQFIDNFDDVTDIIAYSF